MVLFDLVAYFTVPARLTAFTSSYRQTRLLAFTPGLPAMARPYPRHYFRADDVLGFDISPGARAIHEFEVQPHAIFANELGCFDRNYLAALQRATPYYYFAGDSFTWGYADYDSKFATVWESLTGKTAAKCGVSHTGQAHQFDKFKRVAAAIGRYPAIAFVGFYVNDPGNDEAHPHTTVVAGYQVDTAFLKDGAIVHPDVNEVKRVAAEAIGKLDVPPGAIERIKTYVWVYSLSANIVDGVILASKGALERKPAAEGRAAMAPGAQPGRATSRFGDNLYYWYPAESMKSRYASDPMVAANKAAILRWAAHARENSYKLVFLLFPPKTAFDDAEFFVQVKGWLDANGIEHLDLAPLFKQEGLKVDDLYWRSNGHWHAGGNRIVGRLLSERY
jgi:hypothetical protein